MRSDSMQRRAFFIAVGAGLALSTFTTAARAQNSAPATDPLTTATANDMEFGPQDLPGQKQGDREQKPDEKKSADVNPDAAVADSKPEDREWFNGAKFWTWKHLLGDVGGGRTWLENKGITAAGSFTLDWSSVYSGGLRNVASTRDLFDANITADLDKLVKLPGGTIYADFYSGSMRGGSRDVGDIQGISGLETGRAVTQLAQLWYEQKLFKDVLRVKIGKVDANSEFAYVQSGADFNNSSVVFTPALTAFPSYPNPSTAANVFVYPTDRLYAGFGFYDGSAVVGNNTGSLGPAPLFHGAEYVYLAEFGGTWTKDSSIGPGRAGIGAYHHTASFTKFDGNSTGNTSGLYAIAEQRLWSADPKKDDAQSVWCFGQFGFANEDVSATHFHVAGGLVLRGTFPTRESDTTGVYASWVNTSRASGSPYTNDELTLEVYYKLQITGFLSIKPDLQYIINPGGNSTTDNAFVGALRMQVAF